GSAYAEANAMGEAVLEAASRAGIRITLLDACYLQGAPGVSLEGVQRRFGDGTAAAWAERSASLRCSDHARIGAAVHSLRAVPPGEAGLVAGIAAEREQPLHVHLSEQPAENRIVAAAYGASPAAVLESAGGLGPATTAVHATHLEGSDAERIGRSGTAVCICPTTERDLADGIGPAHDLARLGSPLCLGSDSQAVVDPFEELRALELDERLRSGERGRFTAAQLLEAGTAGGHRSLGWPEGGSISPGAPADLVTVSLDSPRLAGADPDCLLEQVVFAATSADVTDVLVGGRHVVRSGVHASIDLVPALRAAIGALVGEL
ncbi:MAG TPA: formimidoylglutamate deiminase, partial [Acidimicrobiales bacterium]|nr:formimidoylglutamate deiminase [Acidimicrobiales bacterium]